MHETVCDCCAVSLWNPAIPHTLVTGSVNPPPPAMLSVGMAVSVYVWVRVRMGKRVGGSGLL